MARMTSAFCCASLKTGTLIIGWVNLVINIVILAVGSTALEVLDQIVQSKRETITTEDLETYRMVKLIVSVFMYGVLALNIILNVSLLYGASKNRRAFLLPYIIFSGIGIAINILSLYPITAHGKFETPLAIRLVCIPIAIYFLCIVTSLYIDLHPANQAAKHQPTVTVQYPVNQTFYAVPPTNRYISVPLQKQDPFDRVPQNKYSGMD